MGENANGDRRVSGPRLFAIVGPFQSGKTTLLECLLTRAGALSRQGSVRDGSSVGDSTAEARAHAASVEANIASVDYLGDRYTFIDLPGSVEFAHEARNVLPLCDAAIVVCEADERKLPALRIILRELEDLRVPRILFLNKIDQTAVRIREILAMLQPASQTPLLLRQIPLWQNDIVTGFIDLALERAFVYREHAPSVVVDVPAGEMPREKEARYTMLERLADYDDALMEELIADIEPPRDQIFDDLTRDLREGLVAPVLIGSAEAGHGVTRLLKALRHESPGLARLRARLHLADDGPALAQAVKTIHTAHGGKLSFARVLRGSFTDGALVRSGAGEDRISGLSRLMGLTASKQGKVEEGDCVAFGRLEHVATGDAFGDAKNSDPAPAVAAAAPPPPTHCVALSVKDRKDEVRLAAAMAKLSDEDPSLSFVQDQDAGELKLYGQGEMHLRVALERLAARFGVTVEARKPGVGYRETIRHAVSTRGRHKKQSGGHGQFGDVALDVAPLPRGEGFSFSETVHGGAVPRNYFGAIEEGCKDAMEKGPLGFPVVDVAVTLTDGSYHTVDSSDMAFRTAARIGMSEALAKAGPVLLEPILKVEIATPSDALSRVTAIVSGRRGQILGYDARPGWDGWDVLNALIPEAEMDGLIVELRSATAGVGSFTQKFDHLAEIVGKTADAIVAHHYGAKAPAH
ncbi:elongation factor G [Rhodoblastus acidophilus]|uniref:Elongation factor G n=1 Tax=Candidatus Rhodoblastus alkanivorans TaxID=2954117 RepID=A0ABS9Z814_9HYPH|nr:elongation factor G [Candidatus Rhodoblastus alkanivorans]MCI4680316.1 elongation factor G [Candidatus Rhodoblastus alkanivorans]MCI4682777.1 elongation factor G [Candidatus Rhodoblastus alkanivorans]MDI4640084.1 elongation factor G [Rhodoblastus acidophilus]